MPWSPTAGPSSEVKIEAKQEVPPQLELGGAGTNVEVDDGLETDDDDLRESGISTGESSGTTSVSSSVFDFTYANGRRYHSDRFQKANYFLPNDEKEQDRLDLYHHQFLTVLDAGTGTGIWAIDFADENPQAEVIGPDISPIQPSWVPPNCKFEVDDLEVIPWSYKNDYFDYVHMRSMSGSFSNWDTIMKEVYRVTAPGGYFEYQDYGGELFRSDGTKLNDPPKDALAAIWIRDIINASEKLGRPLVMANKMKGYMEKVGFINVKEEVAVWTIGEWAKDKRLKEQGRWGLLGLIDSLYPFTIQLMTKAEGWSEQKVQETCKLVEADLKKGKYYAQAWYVHGQKPCDG
ncbi:S-adenosyl-L-methionine-dependent methyltransferase [Kalaharituber pfeilii]|nr:S-adenosyl-L-methionine-dependent methyltransferase [Kalaharituber pfeilii]